MPLEEALSVAWGALSKTGAGLVTAAIIMSVIVAWRGLGLARRRLREDLEVLQQMLHLQAQVGDPEELPLQPSYPLASARRWQHIAYGWSAAKRILFWASIGATLGLATVAAGTSVTLLVAGAVLGAIVLIVLMVVLAAVVFVLVSDLGSSDDLPEDETV